jgi:hypothetical protein
MLGAPALEVREAYERARRLWEIMGRPSGFEPNLGLLWHHLTRGELESAARMAGDIVEAGTVRNH